MRVIPVKTGILKGSYLIQAGPKCFCALGALQISVIRRTSFISHNQWASVKIPAFRNFQEPEYHRQIVILSGVRGAKNLSYHSANP